MAQFSMEIMRLTGSVPRGNQQHDTRTRLETAADTAGWDSFTLLLLISRWLDSAGHSEAIIRDLGELAAAGDTVE